MSARFIAAFAAIYLIWGSTFLAIHYAIGTIPPFMLIAARCLVSGAALYGWMRWRGAPRPGAAEIRSGILTGVLLFVGGQAALAWSQTRVPTGVAALVLATIPLWMVVLDAARSPSSRPDRATTFGLVLGFAGVAILIRPWSAWSGGAPPELNLVGCAVLVLASLSWAVGSILSRAWPRPKSSLMGAALQLLAGGAVLVAVSAAAGEWSRLEPRQISALSLLCLGYLIAAGSLVGFSAYAWLLSRTSAARVATYAYVNPVVAVFLGWAVAGERVNARALLAGAAIVAAVAIITSRPSRTEAPAVETGAPAGAAEAPFTAPAVASSATPLVVSAAGSPTGSSAAPPEAAPGATSSGGRALAG
jgi:drug/metabolite transporter (DMT)-like permease